MRTLRRELNWILTKLVLLRRKCTVYNEGSSEGSEISGRGWARGCSTARVSHEEEPGNGGQTTYPLLVTRGIVYVFDVRLLYQSVIFDRVLEPVRESLCRNPVPASTVVLHPWPAIILKWIHVSLPWCRA